ncbi:hypothetical protein WJX84_010272 [Apatococcus fuscideae]|uniref:Uncharacterized protein n=1 Tax=Apatococcus fuscideae TaxID=2026836 RepID=A0AAW1T7E9_9CHLO
MLKPTSGWPVVILNYAADSTPTAHFHKGALNVGYPQTALTEKFNSKRLSLQRDPVEDLPVDSGSPGSHTPQAWVVRANRSGRITGVDVIDMSPRSREAFSPLQSPATGSESLRNSPRGTHEATPRYVFTSSTRTSLDQLQSPLGSTAIGPAKASQAQVKTRAAQPLEFGSGLRHPLYRPLNVKKLHFRKPGARSRIRRSIQHTGPRPANHGP